MPVPDEAHSVYAKDRKAWRRWLAQHSQSASHAWLVLYRKHATTPSVSYDEAVEEALCFGWIDSKPNKRDAESWFLFFAPRKPRSNWSRSNKERVERLLAAGLMEPPGLAAVEVAKQNGAWTVLDAVSDLVVPPDLKKALAAAKPALSFFEAFPPSVKKGILEWIINAKTPETRARRIAETARLAAQNSRANQYRPKQAN